MENSNSELLKLRLLNIELQQNLIELQRQNIIYQTAILHGIKPELVRIDPKTGAVYSAPDPSLEDNKDNKA